MLHATVYQIGTLPTSDFHIKIINFRSIVTYKNTYYIHYCFVVWTALQAQCKDCNLFLVGYVVSERFGCPCDNIKRGFIKY